MRGVLHYLGRRKGGFGLPEILLVVGVIGILAAIVIPMVNRVHDGIRVTKLESDVKTINTAIDVYRANGGNLKGITDSQLIIDKLKTTRTDKDRVTFVGYSGSMIEKRLAARPLPNEQVGSGTHRAVWDAAKSRFEVGTTGNGVKDFYLNSAFAEIDYSTEERDDSALAWNSGDGWIWEYSDAAPLPPSGPDEFPTGTVPDTTPPVPVQLSAPTFLPPGGTYSVADFPLSVSISHPNPPATWVMVSPDGGNTWSQYSGSITVSAGDELRAYAAGNPAEWIKSTTAVATYRNPAASSLDTPTINLSHSEFTNSATQIQVTIGNSNPAGASVIHYAIKSPSGSYPPLASWNIYVGSFSATSADYPDGFHVKAYAKSLDTVSWTDSGYAEEAAGVSFIGIPITGNTLIILDASSSMGSNFGGISRFEMVIQETISAIMSLPANLKFNVAMFDGGIHWTDGTFKLHNATPPKKQAMIDQILQINHGSGTNYEAGLNFPPMFSPVPEMIIFLSDGEPSSSYNYSSELQALVDLGIPVHTVGVDLDSSALQNLEEIANATGGSVTEVQAP